jgi:hypothetical protein
MNKMKRFQHIYLFTILFSLSVLLSCSDNSAGPDEGPSGKGQASFTITGDITGQKTGIAEFYSFSAFGVHTWSIDIYDIGPTTYDLSFSRVDLSPISRPATGNYTLNSDFMDTSGFTVIYSTGSGNSAVEYTPIFSGLCPELTDEGGTLTIENSSDDRVSGKFEFTASNFDFDASGNCVVLGTITVKGEFEAKKTSLN